MHYVIGDVHGCYDAFMRLLGKLNLKDDDKVILVGDIIDRAPSGRQQKSMIDWALTNIKPDGKYQMVMGNHERDLLDTINSALAAGYSFNGRYSKIYDTVYRFMSFAKKYKVDVERVGRFINDLPLYIELNKNGKRVFVTHSWICTAGGGDCIYDDTYALHEADVYSSVWDREYSLYKDSTNSLVIHGHTPTVSNEIVRLGFRSGKVAVMGGNINIDCGCCFGPVSKGNLAAYCIETDEIVYAYTDEDVSQMIADSFRRDFKYASIIYKEETGKILQLNDFYTENRDYDIDCILDNYGSIDMCALLEVNIYEDRYAKDNILRMEDLSITHSC